MKKTPAKIASEKLAVAVKNIEERKAYTKKLYAVRFPRSKGRPVMYYGPFLSPDDECALQSLFEVSRSEPSLQRKDLYCLGSYCALDGKIVSCKPRLVLGKVEKK